jgi:hypothetical protein
MHMYVLCEGDMCVIWCACVLCAGDVHYACVSVCENGMLEVLRRKEMV